MADESGEKTEEPTQKKIDDSRKKGQVWKSRDMTGVLVFLAGMGALKAVWPMMESELRRLFDFSLETLAHPDQLEQATFHMLLMAVTTLLLLTLPVSLAAAVAGGLADFLQVGPLFSHETVLPKLEKLNPVQGLKNLVSKKQLVELIKSTLKMVVTAYVVYGVVEGAMPLIAATVRTDALAIMTVLGELVFRVSVRVGLLLILFGIFDVWFQHKTYMKDLMMTKEEVKREYKESEGDPHHKAKRREMHMEILESAQMESVKDADVVVTNPTHVAVAIKYDREKDSAPRVVCKGLESRAQAIRELARDANVAILRNVPLAHALHRVEVGQEIPEELYDAVAEVLNFVYGLKTSTVRA